MSVQRFLFARLLVLNNFGMITGYTSLCFLCPVAVTKRATNGANTGQLCQYMYIGKRLVHEHDILTGIFIGHLG